MQVKLEPKLPPPSLLPQCTSNSNVMRLSQKRVPLSPPYYNEPRPTPLKYHTAPCTTKINLQISAVPHTWSGL